MNDKLIWILRHCERSEAIHLLLRPWIASLALAMTVSKLSASWGSGAYEKNSIVMPGSSPVMTISIGMTAKLFRRGADGRTAGRAVQECDRYKRAKPRADRRKGDIDPVFGVADHGVGREQIPDTAPARRGYPSSSHDGGGEHHIDRIRRGGCDQDGRGGQRLDHHHLTYPSCDFSFGGIGFAST